MNMLAVVWAAPAAAPTAKMHTNISHVWLDRPNRIAPAAAAGKLPRKMSRCAPVRSASDPTTGANTVPR